MSKDAVPDLDRVVGYVLRVMRGLDVAKFTDGNDEEVAAALAKHGDAAIGVLGLAHRAVQPLAAALNKKLADGFEEADGATGWFATALAEAFPTEELVEYVQKAVEKDLAKIKAAIADAKATEFPSSVADLVTTAGGRQTAAAILSFLGVAAPATDITQEATRNATLQLLSVMNYVLEELVEITILNMDFFARTIVTDILEKATEETSYDFENEVDAAALVEASELFPSVDPESDELHPILKSITGRATIVDMVKDVGKDEDLVKLCLRREKPYDVSGVADADDAVSAAAVRFLLVDPKVAVHFCRGLLIWAVENEDEPGRIAWMVQRFLGWCAAGDKEAAVANMLQHATVPGGTADADSDAQKAATVIKRAVMQWVEMTGVSPPQVAGDISVASAVQLGQLAMRYGDFQIADAAFSKAADAISESAAAAAYSDERAQQTQALWGAAEAKAVLGDFAAFKTAAARAMASR